MNRYISGLRLRLPIVLVCLYIGFSTGQRITTIQLEGVQYFVSRMNPYSPELNFFLAYQYCRSLGLQLASFETKEKADSITQYLKNAGYDKFDFWTSGNRLGTDMFLWMSTGLPFNATFNYMKKVDHSGSSDEDYTSNLPSGSTSPQRTARESSDSGSANGCVVLRAPTFEWDTDNCVSIKDFICEQTRCYYYNYGSIPVSTAQGKLKPTSVSLPSSSTTESIKNNFIHITSLMNKLRLTTQASRKSDRKNDPVFIPNKEVDVEESTNGPYESVNTYNGEMQDDPSIGVDDNYVSTIEPEKIAATTFETSPS